MPANWIILLVVIPMLGGIGSTFFLRHMRAQRLIGIATLIANLIVAIYAATNVFTDLDHPRILVSQMGDWPAPFGISIVLDGLSALVLAMASIVVLAIYLYCLWQMPRRLSHGLFHPLFHFLILGVQWSLLTGDLFNLFVGFEIMLMASYALLVIGASPSQMRQAYKYVLLNLLGSTLFVTCCGLLYGATGTLNMADLARLSHDGLLPPSAIPIVALLLIVFGTKTAIFPLWFWLPDTYHNLPASLGALFAGLLTKVGAYTLIRTFVMMFGTPELHRVVLPVLLLSAGVTMLLGVLGAVSMKSVRRILSIHIVSQIGYMALGIGLMTELAVAGTIFFILHNMAVKSTLFLCGGIMQELSGTDELAGMGGLLKRAPWLAAFFFIAALSLAGLPPLSGFIGKWMLLKGALDTHHYLFAGVGFFTSLLTLLSMLKIWNAAFWSESPQSPSPAPARSTAAGMLATAILLVVTLSMGFGASLYYRMCTAAARGVLQPEAYIQAVLREAR